MSDVFAFVESDKPQTISALPPRGYMISNGSLTRDLNHDLPQDTATAWTEHEERIFRAIQYEGGERAAAIREYQRNQQAYLTRRFCADTTGSDYHFLPLGARANQRTCGASCRAALAA